MDIARLVLDYLKILIWPAVVTVGLLLFRQQLRDIASRVTRASGLGFEIEAAVRGAQAAVEAAVEANAEDEDVEPSEPGDPIGAWLDPEGRRSSDPATDEVFQAINKLEQNIRSFAYQVDPSLAGRSTLNTLHSLVQRDLLQRNMLFSVADLLELRDRTVGSMPRESARAITDAAMTQLLVVQLARRAPQPTRTRVVGDL